MSDRPDVSVVIPVHNGADYLREAVESALASDVRVEVVVVDDASTDATPEIVAGFGDAVRHLRLDKQPTSIVTTNAGIRLATGELVSILHHDDYYLPGKLRRHVELMAAHPEVGMSYSAQRFVDPLGRALWTLRSPVQRGDYVVEGRVELRHLMVQNYVNFCNAVVRRSVYESVGDYAAQLWVSAEWDMWLRIAGRWAIGYIDEPLVCYRLHHRQQTMAGTTDTAAYLEQLRGVVDRMQQLLVEQPGLLERMPIVRANMHLSTALLQMVRREYRAAARSSLEVARNLRPREIPDLLRSSAVVARSGSRVRLLARRRRLATAGRSGTA